MTRLRKLFRSHRSVHKGQSRKQDDPHFSLEKALENAYKAAKNDHKSPPFRVVNIFVDGNNPLSEYTVYIEADD